MTLPL